VSAIAPIMTEPGGAAWRQTRFFPFGITARMAMGTVLRRAIEFGTVATRIYGDAPVIDAVATLADDGRSPTRITSPQDA